MRDDALTLSYDLGTQSARSLLFDRKGNLLHISKYPFNPPYFSKEKGWTEQDPSYWWSCLCESSRKLKREIDSETYDRIDSVSVTSMRDTYLCLDERNMPLRPAILWLDQRSASCRESLGFLPETLFRLVGMRNAVQETRMGAKSNWLIEHEGEMWARMSHYASIAAWCNFMLSGRLVDSVANQVGHIPFDYKRQQWMSPRSLKWGIDPVPLEKLVPLVPPGTVIGEVDAKGSLASGLREGVKVVATGTDKGCETLGSGCVDSSSASLSFGTTSTVQLALSAYREPQPFLPAYPSLVPGCYNPEVEIFRGYWMITWFIDQFCGNLKGEAEAKGVSIESLLDVGLDLVRPGCDGLLLQPYWGPGLKNPEAKGAILGFSDYHGKYHLYRAIVEGINFALMEGLFQVERRAKVKVRRLHANGGGAKSARICQITADMFGLPLTTTQTTETSGLGSAISSFVATGVFPSYGEAIGNMVHQSRECLPDETNHRLYERLFREEYLPLYKHLKPLYKRIRNIMEESK